MLPQTAASRGRKGKHWIMILEELIYKRLAGSEKLAGYLAVYNGAPAVFASEPPDASQEGWEGSTQYPRVVFNFDMQANQERHSAGVLEVSLLCQNTADIMPEAIEPFVRDCLRDVVLKPQGGTPYCFAWARTDAFTIEGKKGNVVTGSGIRFDILQYPSQETSDPDPVMALNSYIKKLCPGCIVMGHDRMEEITEASANKPVIYCRLVSAEKSRETNTVVWMDARMVVHIICPDSSIRMKTAAGISDSLSLDGEVLMLDGSPMRISRLQADYKSDYLEDGQVFVTGHYGILRYRVAGHVLRDAFVNSKKEEESNMAAAQKNNKDSKAEKDIKETKDTREEKKNSGEVQPQGTAAAGNKPESRRAVYKASELVAAAQAAFNTSPDVVAAALREKNIEECTKEEAKDIIKKFLNREV